MEVKASLNYLRISPRKIKLVVDLIKGMEAEQAQTQLRFLAKKGTLPILKLLNSAVANAKNNFNVSAENLYIKSITVGQGSSLKRWMPRAFGRASPILKRSSHVQLILEEREGGVKKKTKIAQIPQASEKEMPEKLARKISAQEPEKAKPRFGAMRDIGKKRFGAIKRIFQRKAI